jgi:hypothetical protein
MQSYLKTPHGPSLLFCSLQGEVSSSSTPSLTASQDPNPCVPAQVEVNDDEMATQVKNSKLKQVSLIFA